jgi:hypothetical protein
MVEGIVKKIMTTGITKYAKAYGVPALQVQIKVTNNPDGTVFYTMCNNFKEVQSVSFLQIMDKRMDIFQYEALANPFLKKSLELYAKDTNDDILNVCSFIMQVNNNIGLAFYKVYKNGKNISLKNHLGELGL